MLNAEKKVGKTLINELENIFYVLNFTIEDEAYLMRTH